MDFPHVNVRIGDCGVSRTSSAGKALVDDLLDSRLLEVSRSYAHLRIIRAMSVRSATLHTRHAPHRVSLQGRLIGACIKRLADRRNLHRISAASLEQACFMRFTNQLCNFGNAFRRFSE